MGADMIISFIYHHESMEAFDISKKMRDMVDILTDKELKTYYKERNIDYPEREQAIEEQKYMIWEAFDCIESRHVTWINFKGWIIYLSGGDSWGDSPTDEEEMFSKLWYLNDKLLKVMDEVKE